MKHVLKSRKGMTIIEIIVAMLLFAVISAIISAVLVPVIRIYGRVNSLAEINSILDNLSDEIQIDLAGAVSAVTVGTELTVNTKVNSVNFSVTEPGYLVRNGETFPDTDFYKGKTVDIVWDVTDGVIEYEITLFDKDGEPMAVRKYAFKPIGLEVPDSD